MKMNVNEDVKQKLKKFLQYKNTSQFKQEQKIIKDLFEMEDPRYAFKHNQSWKLKIHNKCIIIYLSS